MQDAFFLSLDSLTISSLFKRKPNAKPQALYALYNVDGYERQNSLSCPFIHRSMNTVNTCDLCCTKYIYFILASADTKIYPDHKSKINDWI